MHLFQFSFLLGTETRLLNSEIKKKNILEMKSGYTRILKHTLKLAIGQINQKCPRRLSKNPI